MKIIITESQYTVLDWFSYNEEYFEKIFDHLTDGIFLTNFVWTDDLSLICNKIIHKMVEKFEYKKITKLNDEQISLLFDLYCERISDKFLNIKKNIVSEGLQHNELLYDYFTEYVNDILGENHSSHSDSFIIVWDDSNVEDLEDDILLEYDYTDGRLWLSKNLMYRLKNLIPFDKETIHNITKECFEKKHHVKVSFVESYKS